MNDDPSLLNCVAGLYLITPDTAAAETELMLSKTELALRKGVRCLQYRDKTAGAELRRRTAVALRELTRQYNALLIVNDDPALALAVQADGVHIGRDDGDVPALRRALPASMLLGVSCYDDAARAVVAAAEGANYVAFGAVFDSPTKPAAVRAPLSLFAEARRTLPQSVRCVGIGGITVGNIAQLAAAGADAAAVITAVYGAEDAGFVASQLSSAFYSRTSS